MAVDAVIFSPFFAAHVDPTAWKSQLFRHRTALKMYVWLIQWFASKEDEAWMTKSSAANAIAPRAPAAQRAKKAKTEGS